jgi:hypothetical protein
MGAESITQQHTHPWLVGEIDRNELRRVESLFRAHHNHRLIDAKERLPASARHVLSALPLLLHTNHPGLPGYCGSHIPHGIAGYTADAEAQRAVRQFSSGYAHKPRPTRHCAINALYLMGSAGSVAHTRTSDLDVWVCLPRHHHTEMDKKLKALSQWAATLGVELQSFAVDPSQFTGGTELAFSPLLLDEFYRTACLLAGQYPVWWLIPTSDPQLHWQIAQRLAEQKHIKPDTYLDFGPVNTFTRQEIFAAGVRELERSLDTPHKSLLKLALLESYHEGHPPLSKRYKHVVVGGSPPQHIDGYFMLADHLDTFFTGRPEFKQRQAFMRRAWLTKTSRGNARLWKNPTWWERAHRWGYNPLQIDNLRWPNKWPLTKIINEHHRTIAEFAHALSFLGELERSSGSASTGTARWDEFSERLRQTRTLVLQHTQYNDKLLDAIVPPDQNGHAVIERQGDDAWCLAEDGRVLIQRQRLVQVFMWLKRQGLSLNALQSTTAPIDRNRQIFSALDHRPYVALINAEADAITPAEASGNTLIARETDPLSYGAQRLCLIKHIDLLHNPRHGMHEAKHFDSLVDGLCDIFRHPQTTIIAIGDVRRGRIQSRLRGLIHEASQHMTKPGSTSYIFQLGPGLCCVHKTPQGEFSGTTHSSAEACYRDAPAASSTLLSTRGRLSKEYQWLVSENVFSQPVVLLTAAADHFCLEYRDANICTSLNAPRRHTAGFLQSLNMFRARLKRRGVSVPKLFQYTAQHGIAPLRFDRIDADLRYRLSFRQAAGVWSVQYGQDLWTNKKIDRKLLALIRQRIIKHRSSDELYPIYITDIELEDQDFLGHLRIKFELEAQLSDDTRADHRLEIIRDPS